MAGDDTRRDQAESVQQAVTRLNDYVRSLERDLRFSVDPQLDRPVVQVIDSSTQEVIRQIPNEVVLRLARNLSAGDVLPEQRGLAAVGGATTGSATLGLIDTRI